MNDLEQQWAYALEAAAHALEAASRARALPPDELGARRRRLAVERAWLTTVDWPRLGENSNATITVLEAPSKVVRSGLVRSAA